MKLLSSGEAIATLMYELTVVGYTITSAGNAISETLTSLSTSAMLDIANENGPDSAFV